MRLEPRKPDWSTSPRRVHFEDEAGCSPSKSPERDRPRSPRGAIRDRPWSPKGKGQRKDSPGRDRPRSPKGKGQRKGKDKGKDRHKGKGKGRPPWQRTKGKGKFRD